MIIKGKKIDLHPYDEGLIKFLFKWHNNDDFDDLMSDEVGPKSVLDIKSIYSKFMPEQGGRLFIAATKEDVPKPIGVVALSDINLRHRKAQIWGGIGETVDRRKGYGNEGIELMIKWASNQFMINRFYAYVKEHNTLAKNTLEKCGFVLDAIIKDDVFQDGEFKNTLLMSFVNNRRRK